MKTLFTPNEMGRWYEAEVLTHPLTVGEHVIDLCELSEGITILDARLVIDTAAVNASGTTVLIVRTDESTEKVLFGNEAEANPINLETAAQFALDDATNGADDATLLRPRLTSNADNRRIKVQAEITVGAAAATAAAAFRVFLLGVRKVPKTGP